MKLRYLATVVVLSLTTVAAYAQSENRVGLYLNPLAIRVSNPVVDNGPLAFLGQNSTSQVFYGFDLGGYYDFFHSGKLDAGFDIRESDLHANNALLKSFLVGARVSAHPFTRPFKPYLQASIGLGTTKPPASTIHISKVDYAIYGGLDYTLQRHVDFRVVEVGYGSLTTASSATVGAGGNIAIPASNLVSFSSGLIFRF
ncbi:MAG: outer membrane beta-barrel protein [Acidobacteriaceae bacterium]|jgi:hypothetical protein